MSNAKEGFAINVHRAIEILDKLREELSKFSKEQLLQQNVDAVSALIMVRRVQRELIQFRPLIQQLPLFNIDNFDRLELFATAFVGAQAQYKAIKERNKEPAALFAEGIALRSRLLSDTKTLVRRGLVAPDPLDKLRGGRGYKQVAADLVLLATLLETRSGTVKGRCATTPQELARAEALADQLTVAVLQRREPRKAEADALDLRRRAFTLFFGAYSEVRRAVQYLRYAQGDADRIAPPLTGNYKTSRKTRPKDEVEQQGKTVAGATTEQSIAADGEQRSPFESQAVSVTSPPNTKEPSEEATPASAGHIGVGLPGSDPFLN